MASSSFLSRRSVGACGHPRLIYIPANPSSPSLGAGHCAGHSLLSPFHSNPSSHGHACAALRCGRQWRWQKRSEGIWNGASKNSLLTLTGQIKAKKGLESSPEHMKGRGKSWQLQVEMRRRLEGPHGAWGPVARASPSK